jgi:hypothetical protein
VFAAVQHAETDTEAAADPRVGLNQQQQAMPSGVVSASKTIDGCALIRRTSVRLVIGPSPAV